jgi:hypothetical protein
MTMLKTNTNTNKIRLAALISILAGCASADADTASGADDIVVGVTDLNNRVTVNPDSLEFDATVLPQLQPHLAKIDAYVAAADKSTAEPVFLIGDRQSDAKSADGSIKDGIRNPLGYLRRAVGYTTAANGNIVVQTEEATIAEASDDIFKGNVAGIVTKGLKVLDDTPDPNGGDDDDDSTAPPPPPPKATAAPPNNSSGAGGHTWSYQFGGADGFTPIDLSGKVLGQQKILGAGTAKVVLTKGKVDIRPKIDATLVTEGIKPKSGQAVITTAVVGDIQVDATADGSFNLQKGDTLYSKQFGGTLTGAVGAGLPLTMQVDVKYECDLGSSGKVHAMIGGHAEGQLTAGASFEGVSLSPIFPPPTYDLSPVGPQLDVNATVEGECHLVCSVALQVFDAAGPNASVDLYAKAEIKGSEQNESTTGTGSLTVGVQATVGGQLKPFGFTIATIKTDPLVFEKTFTDTVKIGGQ